MRAALRAVVLAAALASEASEASEAPLPSEPTSPPGACYVHLQECDGHPTGEWFAVDPVSGQPARRLSETSCDWRNDKELLCGSRCVPAEPRIFCSTYNGAMVSCAGADGEYSTPGGAYFQRGDGNWARCLWDSAESKCKAVPGEALACDDFPPPSASPSPPPVPPPPSPPMTLVLGTQGHTCFQSGYLDVESQDDCEAYSTAMGHGFHVLPESFAKSERCSMGCANSNPYSACVVLWNPTPDDTVSFQTSNVPICRDEPVSPCHAVHIEQTGTTCIAQGNEYRDPLSLTECHAAIAQLGHSLDDNDDGQVTLDEFRMSARPGRMRGGMPGDGDGDGNVSIDELNAYLDAREAEQAERRARLTERFAAADGDGDGVVTRGEARAARFTRLDANGDGALTPDEMRQGRKGMRGHGQGKGPGGLGHRPWRQDW